MLDSSFPLWYNTIRRTEKEFKGKEDKTMMMTGYAWEDLMELRKASVEFVMAWFVAHGEAEKDLDLDLDEDGDGELHVGGYWSDAHPVVEFEDGIVVRWYRSGYWD